MPMFTYGPPRWAIPLIAQVAQIDKEIRSMAAVQIEQSDLDTLAAALEAVKTSLAAEIESLKTQLPAANLSGLTQALTDLQGLEPPASTA